MDEIDLDHYGKVEISTLLKDNPNVPLLRIKIQISTEIPRKNYVSF